jgi:alkylhydroperoxidase family enzyme
MSAPHALPGTLRAGLATAWDILTGSNSLENAMSLLKTVPPASATGEVAAIYTQMAQAWGNVPSVMQVWSASPFLLKQQWEFIGYSMQHPSLSFALLACVRMLVSQAGRCDYCIEMNAGLLVNMGGWTPEQVAATRADYQASPLPEREKLLLGLVLKAVRDAHSVTAQDLDAARAAGWSDGDILDAVAHGARMAASDIIINAFKVERDF